VRRRTSRFTVPVAVPAGRRDATTTCHRAGRNPDLGAGQRDGGTPGSLGPAAWTSTSPTRIHPERGIKHLDGRAFALATVRAYDVWIDAVGTRLGDAQPNMPDGVTDRPAESGNNSWPSPTPQAGTCAILPGAPADASSLTPGRR
jgi:hypothetical protein